MKSTRAKIIPSGVKLKAFLLKSVTRQGCPLLSFFKQYQKSQPEKSGIQIGKEETKLSLFTDDMILCVENSKFRPCKKTIRTNKLSKIAGHKSRPMQNPVVFL